MAKELLTEHAHDISRFILGVDNVQVLENLDTEQQVVIGQRADSTKRIRIDNEEAILHIELQVRDSTPKPMWARNAAYHGYLIGEYQLPVYSNVLYFHPSAGRRDGGVYEYSMCGYAYRLRYKVIRLIEVAGESILALALPGLLPFTPLMKPPGGLDSAAWIQRCITATTGTDLDEGAQGDLLCALSVFGGVVHDASLFKRLIPEGLMRESKYFQLLRDEFIAQGIEQSIEQGMERGMERGAKETTIKNTLAVLSAKFSPDTVNALAPALQRITDLQHLELLLLTAIQAESLDTFTQSLNR